MHQAEGAPRQIIDLLEDISAASPRFEARNKQRGTAASLHSDGIKTAFVKKTVWALHGKNDLDRLPGEIIELTSQIISLFLIRASVQKELCIRKV